jgi:hypothetical protein
MRGMIFLLAAALLVALAGCGEERPAELSGTVKLDDKPLSSGTVWVVAADGSKRHSGIGPKGQYSVQGVPAGTASVYVESHARVPSGLGGGQGPSLPERYAKADTSGLSIEVTGRDQKADILMTSVAKK